MNALKFYQLVYFTTVSFLLYPFPLNKKEDKVLFQTSQSWDILL
jgi:hypothetical protein